MSALECCVRYPADRDPYHSDGLGSTRALTDPTGAVVELESTTLMVICFTLPQERPPLGLRGRRATMLTQLIWIT